MSVTTHEGFGGSSLRGSHDTGYVLPLYWRSRPGTEWAGVSSRLTWVSEWFVEVVEDLVRREWETRTRWTSLDSWSSFETQRVS